MIEFLSRAFGGDKSEKPKAGKRINLALQGGGALGAFTWGVLDHLLEDGRLTIEGISGASAGAVNAIMLADGLARGGPDEARKRLADFWKAASMGGNLPELQRRAVDRLFSFWPIEDTPVGLWMQALTRYLSPYDFNPLNINPLKPTQYMYDGAFRERFFRIRNHQLRIANELCAESMTRGASAEMTVKRKMFGRRLA
jgi:NTE family protein